MYRGIVLSVIFVTSYRNFIFSTFSIALDVVITIYECCDIHHFVRT